MTAEEIKAQKARAMIYKRPALASLGYEAIIQELDEISSECDEVSYAMDISSVIDALDGEEETAHEFQMMFSDLSYDCSQLYDKMYDSCREEEFDDLTVALIGNRYDMVGYDSYETDWYSLTGYQEELAQTEAGKRIMRHTKSEMLSLIGQAMGTLLAFLDLRQKYDYLKATMDIIRGENSAHLKLIADIEKAYEAANADHFSKWGDETRKYDELLNALPDRVWIE